jgi:hypothetical protein
MLQCAGEHVDTSEEVSDWYLLLLSVRSMSGFLRWKRGTEKVTFSLRILLKNRADVR